MRLSPEYLSTQQAADLVGVRVGTILRWLRAGLLSASRLPGGQYRIARADLLDMLDALRQDSTEVSG